MADFEVTCPHCQQSLDCPEVLRGKSAKCPACKQVFEIPKTIPPIGSEIPPRLADLQLPATGNICKKPQHGVSAGTLIKWFFIPCCVLICIILVAMQIESKNKAKVAMENIKQSDKFYMDAESSIEKGDIKAASAFLAVAISLRHSANAIDNEKFNDLNNQLKTLKLEKTEHNYLLLLSADDYATLDNGKFTKHFLRNEILNKMLIDDMYNNRNRINELKANKEEQKRKDEMARKIQEEQDEAEYNALIATFAAKRDKYANELRNRYLDAGLDIKVFVSGKDNTQLILKYVLFNDVWMRKFKTSGQLEEWHSLGFTYIEIRDGYNYSKYVSWDK